MNRQNSYGSKVGVLYQLNSRRVGGILVTHVIRSALGASSTLAVRRPDVRAFYLTRQPHFEGVLFGKRIFQDALLRIAREGSVGTTAFDFEILASALASTGFITRSLTKYAKSWSLDLRHPAHSELITTLHTLDHNLVVATIPPPGEVRLVRGDAPLAHSRLAAIRVLIALLQGPMTKNELLKAADQRPPAV